MTAKYQTIKSSIGQHQFPARPGNNACQRPHSNALQAEPSRVVLLDSSTQIFDFNVVAAGGWRAQLNEEADRRMLQVGLSHRQGGRATRVSGLQVGTKLSTHSRRNLVSHRFLTNRLLGKGQRANSQVVDPRDAESGRNRARLRRPADGVACRSRSVANHCRAKRGRGSPGRNRTFNQQIKSPKENVHWGQRCIRKPLSPGSICP